MTVRRIRGIAPDAFIGLSSDTKPTKRVLPGAFFFETDTNDFYRWKGSPSAGATSDWVLWGSATTGARHVRIEEVAANTLPGGGLVLTTPLVISQTISASGSQAYGPIDLRSVDLNHATIYINVSGSGTVKLTGVVGIDQAGTADSPETDLKTGMTTNSDAQLFELSDANLPGYGHYLSGNFTETGGAATVTVSAYLAARVR